MKLKSILAPFGDGRCECCLRDFAVFRRNQLLEESLHRRIPLAEVIHDLLGVDFFHFGHGDSEFTGSCPRHFMRRVEIRG